MKTLEMSQATGELSSYAEDVQKEPLVVTDKGKPVMALLPIANADLETVSLSTDPRFIALIERSRTLHKPGTGIPLREIRRKYGLETRTGAEDAPVAPAGVRRSGGTMARPYKTRYIGNTNKQEVHDLHRETPYCWIDEILAAGDDVPFATLSAAKRARYDGCHHCLGGSGR